MASDRDDVIVARIPSDVVDYKILPRLPYKSLSRFKCICKKWHHLISHDIVFAHEQSRHGSPISFGYVYQHKQSIDFIPIDIPGELNVCITNSSFFSLPIGAECIRITAVVDGLLLLFLQRKSDEQNDSMCSINYPDAIGKFHYVWNLVTKEGHVIPKTDRHCWFVGLAFDPWITPACYKLVNLVQRRKGLREEFSFDVYSSRTRKWTMSDHKFVIPKGTRTLWNIFCAGRIIYWASNPYVLWFDVEKDVAGYTLLPQLEALGGSRHVLGATNDGILTSTHMLQHSAITVWMMSEDGDWVKKVSLENVPTVSSEFKLFIPLPFTGGDRIYMEMLSYCMSKRILVCYNINTREMTMIGEMKDVWPPSKCLYIDYNRIARLGSLGVTEC
ncbi:unnamed protein product [Musa acuminata subsp. malaccensis]|uniref:(wild Malaysian banana) hypothetical protein n=1 Tax=Musa acuminata subsp. malaccensis TaxID=214687 RepID=A0A804JQ34_MUSAM|nr:PREDICTED: putative F-box protein At3g16210 [Musa acuminata subsp. malaccensis]CAG1848642.1 unnamed protein product [Musa acuminata subsp. malaccensis]